MVNYEAMFGRFSSPAVLFSYKDGEIFTIHINQSYLNELGLTISSDDFIKANPKDAFDEESLNIYTHCIEDVIQNRAEKMCETRRRLISGNSGSELIYVRSIIYYVEEYQGGHMLYETVSNITQRATRFEAMRENMRRFQIASDQVNIYYWEYDVATKDMHPCYRCMRDLGLPPLVKNYPESVIEQGIVPEEYADMVRQWHRQLETEKGEIEVEIPLTEKRTPFRVKLTTEFRDGKLYKVYGSATVISETEKKKHELDVRIINRLADGYSCIYLCNFEDDTLQIIKQNPNETICAFEEGSYSENFAKLSKVVDENYARTVEHLRDIKFVSEALFRGSPVREFNYSHVEGKRWYRTTYYVLEQKDRKVTKALLTNTLIDDELSKRFDKDVLLAKQKAELEERQVLLIKAVEEANKANSAKTAFFSNMSHDIRTPMNAIVGYAHLAGKSVEDADKTAKYLEKISIASDYMLNIINDILDMSRIESGKMEIIEKPENIREVIDDVYDIICQQMEQKNIEFICDYSDIEHAYVYCDRVKMRQIMLNLLSNAYKFTPEEGRVLLSVREKITRNKSTYIITVKDSGIGMSESYLKKIWDPFTREENQTVHGIQGTGLGMAIVKSLVSLMKGTITVKSAPGAGSEFTLNIPFGICEEDIETEEKKETLDIDFTGKKILLVEDIEMNREIAREVLENLGAVVIEATNGIEAVELVSNSKEGDIDIILMDIMMPVMNGYEATRKIRCLNNDALARIPIIAMTANAFAEDIREAMENGMNAHISKPFNAHELAVTIGKLL